MNSTSELEKRLKAFYQSEWRYRAPDRVLAETMAAVLKTKQRRVRRGVPWRISSMMNASRLAVAAVVVVAVVGLGLAFLPGLPNPGTTSSPTPSPTPSSSAEESPKDEGVAADEKVIADYLNAYFGGNVDTAMQYRDETPESAPGPAAEIRYQELMGASVTVGCVASETPGAIDCDIAYANKMFSAAGAQPHTTTKIFRVDGGRVYVLDYDYPGDTPLSRSFDGYLDSIGLGDEHGQACPLEPATPYHTRPDDCAAFESSHIDDWASWYATSVVWTEVEGWTGLPPRWVSEYPTGGFVAGSLNQRPMYSVDGLTWNNEPFDPALASYRDVYIAGEYALANSLGSDSPEIDDSWVPGQGQSSPIAWEVLLRFVDGTWQAIDSGEPIIDPPTRFDGVTLLNYRNPDGTYFDRYLSTSDGMHFTYHQLPGNGGPISAPEFVQLPDGVGLYSEAHTMWVSDDGTTWAPLGLDFAPHASGGPGVVKFVTYGDLTLGQAWDGDYLWMTDDGRTWDRVAEPPRTLGQYETRRLHVTDDGLLLSAASSDGAAKLWASTDGLGWDELVVPPGGPRWGGLFGPDRVFMAAGGRVFLFGAPGTHDTPFWVGVRG